MDNLAGGAGVEGVESATGSTVTAMAATGVGLIPGEVSVGTTSSYVWTGMRTFTILPDSRQVAVAEENRTLTVLPEAGGASWM